MVELSTGFDIMAAVVQAAVGEMPTITVSEFDKRFSGLYYVVKQTSYLKEIFDACEKEEWCWGRNYVSDEMIELTKNDMEHTNYMIYASEEGDPIAKLLNNDLK